MGNRAAASSPLSRDDGGATPLSSDHDGESGGGRHHIRFRDRDHDKEPHRPFPYSLLSHLPPSIRSYVPNLDDPRLSSLSYRISLAVFSMLLVAAAFAIPSLWFRLTAPYLCYKEGIVLRCPGVKDPVSLWENPHASTTSWKPCAERRDNGISDLPPENETTGYIFIHAEGGLNQQRIAICNAVAVAKIMNATLILPVLKQDQIWKDQTKLEGIFDVDHFIEYLKDDVRIVRDIPDWFTDKAELFTSIRLPKKSLLAKRNWMVSEST